MSPTVFRRHLVAAVSAAEWIAKRRAALGLLSAYAALRGTAGDLTAAVAVGSLGIRGSDITAAEDDARESLPRALDALEAVLDRARMEQDDAESAMTYAAEINDAPMLAHHQARKQAWADAARALTTAMEAS